MAHFIEEAILSCTYTYGVRKSDDFNDLTSKVFGVYNSTKAAIFNAYEGMGKKNKRKNENKLKPSLCKMTGLVNLGNTCYMNSTIQTLFLCERFREEILTYTPTESQVVLSELRATFGCLLEGKSAYEPTRFLEVAKPPWFEASRQHDSSEFLRYLLNQIHEEQQSVDGIKQASITERLFGGTLVNSFQCENCNHTSNIEEMFFDLQLSFSKRSYTAVPLKELFANFVKIEKLIGEHKYYCDNCHSFAEATKTTHITRYPKYLILTLMRFTDYGMKNFQTKNSSPVDYPEIFKPPGEQDLKYDLNGVIIHSGYTPYSGHYYCYGQSQGTPKSHDLQEASVNNKEWFVFNDSWVYAKEFDSFKEKDYTSRTSYVLVYSKKTDYQTDCDLLDSTRDVLALDLQCVIHTRLDEQNVEVDTTTSDEDSEQPNTRQGNLKEREREVKEKQVTKERIENEIAPVHVSATKPRETQAANGDLSQKHVQLNETRQAMSLKDLEDATLLEIETHVSDDLQYLYNVLCIDDIVDLDIITTHYPNPDDAAYQLINKWVLYSGGSADELNNRLQIILQDSNKLSKGKAALATHNSSRLIVPYFENVSNIVLNILAEIEVSYWRQLGSQLDVSDKTLDKIEELYYDDTVCANYAVLTKWREDCKKRNEVKQSEILKHAFMTIGAVIDKQMTVETYLKERKPRGKIPVISDTKEDTLKNLAYITGCNWKRLAQNLKISEEGVKLFLKINQDKGVETACFKMLDAWTYNHFKNKTDLLMSAYQQIGFEIDLNDA